MDNKKAAELLTKYAEGRCTPREIGQLHEWYLHYERTEPGEMSEIDDEAQLARIRERLAGLSERDNPLRKTLIWRNIAAAVAVVVVLSGLLLFNIRDRAPDPAPAPEGILTDLSPATDRAILTLEDGRQILLDSTFSSEMLAGTGVGLTRTKDGILRYTLSDRTAGAAQTHRIETPRGGHFQMTLPDGTTVQLNAASTLEYFTGALPGGERRVKLTGEAYFEVARKEGSSFIVQTKEQTIQVLGTKFNVTTYPEESHSRTVLIEGSVRVQTPGSARPINLHPGQAAVTTDGNTRIHQANMEGAVAWTQGYFMFDDEPIESIMRKIARWYDVAVEFKAIDKKQVFSGTVSRFENVSKVLEKLELTGGVHFELETGGHSGKERRIIVMP